MANNDILDRKDLIQLVDAFYEKVKNDPLLGPVFQHVNWPEHLPVMYDFWSSMILGDQRYKGNPLQHHLHLPIGKDHFAQWLLLFTRTVDENFSGTTAEEIKMRAHAIAGVFQHKMGLMRQ